GRSVWQATGVSGNWIVPSYASPFATETKGLDLLKFLDRIKWLLWHGNLHRALPTVERFEDDMGELEADYPNLRKLAIFASSRAPRTSSPSTSHPTQAA